MAVTSMKSLLEAGVHFGHRTRRWNPKMKSFIFTERNGVHIIDLQQTMTALTETTNLIRDTVADGGVILFVGTKRQAQETIEFEANRCGMPYVSQRWLGGTLTNWQTISDRIEYLKELEARRDRGEFELLTKKEALGLTREIAKLNVRLGGIREMDGLPDLMYVVDIKREATAVREANKLEIPLIAIVDTNCDPDPVDYLIPANDDAIRAIKLITSLMADAVIEGMDLRKAYEPETVEDAEVLGEEDEKYLSAATLARLRELSFDDEDKDEEEGAPELPPFEDLEDMAAEATEDSAETDEADEADEDADGVEEVDETEEAAPDTEAEAETETE